MSTPQLRPVATREQLEKIYKEVTGIAMGIINDDEEEADAQVIMFNDKGEVLTMMPPGMANSFQSSEVMKDRLMLLMRAVLNDERLETDIVVHVTEAWIRVSKGKESMEEMEAALEKYGSISEMPDRAETLVVSMHTREGTYLGNCPITTDAAGKRHATFQPIDFDMQLEGRLINERQGVTQ